MQYSISYEVICFRCLVNSEYTPLKIFLILQYSNGILLSNNFSDLQYKCCKCAIKRYHHQLWNYNTSCVVKLHYVLVINFHYNIVKSQ